MYRWKWSVTAGLCLASTVAYAAGFEKAVLWSGQYAGVGNVTAPEVEGAQALAFNPAGLAAAGARKASGALRPFELSLQFSPTWTQLKGPISSPTQLTSETGFLPIFAGFAAWHPTSRFGLAAGVYEAGGMSADYKNVDFSRLNPNFDTLKPEFKAYLRIIDLSVGAGYELLDGLRVGAAWRISLLDADIYSATPVPAPAGAPAGTPPVALVSAQLKDLTDTRFSGFRLGAQYAPHDGWFAVGVDWRTPVAFTAKGSASGSIESGTAAGPASPVPGGSASISSELPSQIAAGLMVRPLEALRLLAEYDYTNYGIDRRLTIAGALQTPQGPVPIPDIVLDWSAMHTVRVGAEFTGITHLALRAGYVFTSAVTSTAHARATLAVPGPAHTITLGAGTDVVSGLRLDGAFEYSFGSADGTNELGIPGSFEERAFGVHLGAVVVF